MHHYTHVLHLIPDSISVGTTPQNTEGQISYIVRPQRRPSFPSESQRHRSGNSVFPALVLGEVMTANNVHAGHSTKDQYYGITGLQSRLSPALYRTDALMTRSMMDGAAGTHWLGQTDNCNTCQLIEHIA